MAIIQKLILLLFFSLTITLLIFKLYNFKKLYIDIVIFLLIILGALQSSLLNGPYVLKLNKQKSDEYIKEINSRYPVAPSRQIPQEYIQFSNIVEKTSLLKPTDNNNIAILQDGDRTYRAIFNEMNNAKHHIHIEDFIIRADDTGKKFQEILIKKSLQGVKVRLIIDAVGFELKRPSIQKLQKSGVELIIRSPIFNSIFQGVANNRDHRKIYIIDGRTAFTGGINIGNEYLGKNLKMGYWRDTDIMLTGDSAKQLQSIFLSSWYAHTGQKILDSKYYPEIKSEANETIQIATGYPEEENSIEYVYLSLIRCAQKNIFIETPYLTLDDRIFKALSSAALKNIDVTIIIPSKPDEKIVHASTLQYSDKLTAFGVKVYKYPAFIHSKLIIIDESIASLGTVNFNNRSMHLDLENTAILYGGNMLDSLNKTFQDDLSKSKPFILGESKPKGIVDFIFNKLSQIISSII